MKTLYVSDLDGTLLNSASRIGPESLRIINRLVDEGMLFTYATARSLVSASRATEGLSARVPVIAYNGTYIFDPQTGSILHTERFSDGDRAAIRAALERFGISPMTYAWIGGRERLSWNEARLNDGKRFYLAHRPNDPRLRPLPDESGVYDGDVFYYTTIGTREELLPLWESLRAVPSLRCTLQRELNRPEYWCEVMPAAATKYHAVLWLKNYFSCDRVVSFGDSANDLPMFRISDVCCAVSNAMPELKAAATAVIGSSDEDAVAKRLEEEWAREGRQGRQGEA